MEDLIEDAKLFCAVQALLGADEIGHEVLRGL